jgi:cell surface protein SprA
VVISRRLAEQRVNNQVTGSPVYDPTSGNAPGYADGYGPTDLEVLIPAFMAAYSNKSADAVSLDAMPGVLSMMPNWRIQYSGLERQAFVKKYLKQLSINHTYRSTYSVGNYTTNLFWNPDEMDGMNYVRDAQENFLPSREIGSISISESLSPLIGFDALLQNSLQARVELKRTRNLTLSLNNNQLMENRSNDIIIGTGYRFEQVPVTIKAGGTQRKFQSDLDLRFDLSIRESIIIMRKLEEDVNVPTSGQTVVTAKFTAGYRLSSRFELKFYFDQVVNKPIVQTSYPTANTKIGFNLRFTLANM